MRLAERARPFAELTAVAVSLLAVVGSYTLLLDGPQWWTTAALVVSVVAAVSAVARSLGTQWSWAFGLAAHLALMLWLFVPSTLWGILPTGRTFEALQITLRRAFDQIAVEPAPAPATAAVTFVLVGSLGLVVVAADLELAHWRSPILIGVALLVMLSLPSIIVGSAAPTWTFLVPAACWLALLVLSNPARVSGSLSPALAAVAVVASGAVIAASTLIAPLLPDTTGLSSPLSRRAPEVFGSGINPMLALGQNLRQNDSVPAARYVSSSDGPTYLRVSVLSDFSGAVWRPNDNDRADPTDRVRISADTSTVRTSVAIDRLRSRLLPVTYRLTGLSGLEGDWDLQQSGRTVRSSDTDTRGQSYTVVSQQVDTSGNRLRALGRTQITRALQPYIQLPSGVSDRIVRTAQRVAGNRATTWDQAVALEDFLRTGPFEYSETAPVDQGFDGSGLDAVDEFLQVRQGYCVHFSAAMAVMARTLGMPSRIVVGYAPGAPVGFRGADQVFEVTSGNLHAWTEIFIDGAGWVRFDPTPGIGQSTTANTQTENQPDAAAPPTIPQPEATPAPAAPEQDQQVAPESQDAATQQDETGGSRGLLALALLMVLAAPVSVRLILRHRRLRGGANQAWQEISATAVDLGLDDDRLASPAEFSHRLFAALPPDAHEAREALETLREAVEVARFAPPGRQVPFDASRAPLLIAALESGVPRWKVWVSRVIPRSLVKRTMRADERVGSA